MMTTYERDLETLRQSKARRDFLTFLDYVRIQEPPTPANPEGSPLVAFEKWPHLVEAATILLSCLLVVALKARQIGWSWLVAAYVVWYASYHPSALIFLFSRGEYEAKQLLSKCKVIWRNLPESLRVKVVNGQGAEGTDLEMELDNRSRIHAFASTKDTGRSETASIVVYDEGDFHEWLQANFAATKPTVDAGGQMILISTSNKRSLDSLFKALYRGAPSNGWRSTFAGWDARPGRDQAWYDRTRAAVPATEEMTPELYMEQEYPRTAEEALAPSRALAWFDVDVLTWMLANQAQEPMNALGYLSTWKPPAVGRHYVIGGDTAWGRTGSYTAATVNEWETGEQVAEFWGRPAPNEAAYELFQLHKAYNHAFIGVEMAGEGQERDGDAVVVVEKLEALMRDCSCAQGKRLPMLYYHDHDAAEPKKPGWQTDGRSRPVMLGEWREVIREHQATIHSRGGISEMMTFIQNEKGRPEAAKGAFDDRVMSYAIMWQMRKHAKFKVALGSRRELRPIPIG